MHPYDIMLLVSVSRMIGFAAMMASRESLRLYLAYIPASVIGTFAGGWAGFRFLPIHPQFALIFGALAGGVLLVVVANRAMRGR